MHGMKREPPDRVGAAAIGLVAHDRMAASRQMTPDLTLASRLQSYLHDRRFRIPLHHSYVRYRKFPLTALSRRIHTECGVLRKVRPDGEVIRRYLSLHDGNIPASCTVILELILQPLLRFDGLREYQQPRRLPIQPMHDEDLLGILFIIRVRAQGRICSVRSLSFGRHCQQSGWFIHYDDAFVFENKLETVVLLHKRTGIHAKPIQLSVKTIGIAPKTIKQPVKPIHPKVKSIEGRVKS